MNNETYQLVVIGISHKTSTVNRREPFLINRNEIPSALNYFKSVSEVEEIVLISTCNRMEFYFVLKQHSDPFSIINDFYCRTGVTTPLKKDLFYVYCGIDVAKHLWSKGTRLRSSILVETH